MYVRCVCGYHSHIDAEFAYNVQCPKCGRIWHCNGHIELIEVTEEVPPCVVRDVDPYDLKDDARGVVDVQEIVKPKEIAG